MQWLRINENSIEIEKYPLRLRNRRLVFNGHVASGGGHLHKKWKLMNCRAAGARSEHVFAGLPERN